MRIHVHFDGADTERVRELAAELAKLGKRQSLHVGCDGPEKWSGFTPPLTPNEFAAIYGRLVVMGGETIASLLDRAKGAVTDHDHDKPQDPAHTCGCEERGWRRALEAVRRLADA